MVLERDQWNTSQLMSQILQNCVGGTPVSWFWANSGVPSDGEKVVRHEPVHPVQTENKSIINNLLANFDPFCHAG